MENGDEKEENGAIKEKNVEEQDGIEEQENENDFG